MEKQEIVTSFQRQILTYIAPVMIIATVIGTFFVSQYRQGEMEKRQSKMEDKLSNVSDDVIAIKTKLGINSEQVQKKSETVLSDTSQRNGLPVSEPTVKFEEEKDDTSAQINPTPVPTPEQKRSIEDILPKITLPPVVPSIINRIF